MYIEEWLGRTDVLSQVSKHHPRTVLLPGILVPSLAKSCPLGVATTV